MVEAMLCNDDNKNDACTYVRRREADRGTGVSMQGNVVPSVNIARGAAAQLGSFVLGGKVGVICNLSSAKAVGDVERDESVFMSVDCRLAIKNLVLAEVKYFGFCYPSTWASYTTLTLFSTSPPRYIQSNPER